MSEWIKPAAEWCAAIVEVIGIGVIAAATLYGLVLTAIQLTGQSRGEETFDPVRLHLGHGILLGLEFLVAADIIHTVAVELTFETVGVLAIIVLIRMFLSFTLAVELTGKWPWQEQQARVK